jgi:hypothetical protein
MKTATLLLLALAGLAAAADWPQWRPGAHGRVEGDSARGRFTIPERSKLRQPYTRNLWPHPVVANGRLYLRDRELLFCYDVKDHPP